MDSPKCQECRKKGIEAQTYKVCGKPLFLCRICGNFFEKEKFEPIEFGWRTQKEAYRQWIESKKNSTVLTEQEA